MNHFTVPKFILSISKAASVYGFFRRAGTLSALLLVLILSACASPSQQMPVVVDQRAVVVTAIVESFMAETGTPGVTATVLEPGRPEITVAMGLSSIEPQSALTEENPFRIGSVTKEFTATVIMQLAQEGLVGLDDRLARFYPQIPNSDRITVSMLLQHTSGFPEHETNSRFQQMIAENPLKVWTLQELIDANINGVTLYPPGEAFHYSNINYQLLGGIAEMVTAKELPRLFDEKLFRPLGMTATFWPAGVEPVSGLAHGYALAGGSTHDVTYSLHPSVAGAAGALISNLHDMKIWARAVARGDLLSEEMQKKRLEWITPGSSDQMKVGLGIIYDHGLIGFHGAFEIGRAHV